MGPEGSTDYDVYLRTAVSVDPQGWAQFGHVKMPDYRWGIFLNPGDAEPQDPLRRPQGREGLAGRARRAPRQPAPHHRHAGRHRAGVGRAAAPPGPDRAQPCTTCATCSRSTSRKAATCGRWSTCCTSTSAATAARKPRRCSSAAAATRTTRASCGAFNEKTPDWLAFFMFTYFTDRDGKFQLCALAESALRPAGAHDQVHADRRSAPHVRRRVAASRRVIQRTCAGDERAEDRRPGQAARGRRDRPADAPALPELPLQRDDRPVRRRRVEQRRHLLQHRA